LDNPGSILLKKDRESNVAWRQFFKKIKIVSILGNKNLKNKKLSLLRVVNIEIHRRRPGINLL
jgi:hypothetical protein